jgi:Glycine-rich domain-containing protein-like
MKMTAAPGAAAIEAMDTASVSSENPCQAIASCDGGCRSLEKRNQRVAMDSDNRDCFSFDLAALALQHVRFLEQVHACGASIHPSAESLRRYRDLWLPLVAAAANAADAAAAATVPVPAGAPAAVALPLPRLIPPPDIAWLWHCHRLAPVYYTKYCHHEFGVLLEANPPFAVALSSAETCCNDSDADETQSLWRERYPNESFYLSKCEQEPDSAAVVSIPLLDFDLMGSARRQATFLWQISGPRYSDQAFLSEGVENYAKFLKLKPAAVQRGFMLVPTYQIDLIWHTHILISIGGYNADCLRLMSMTMPHNDSFSDRSEDGVLNTAFKATGELWMETYGVKYSIPGGMYRGEPPAEFYSSIWTKSHSGSVVRRLQVAPTSSASPRQWSLWTTLRNLDARHIFQLMNPKAV